jgi:hypothetical protein
MTTTTTTLEQELLNLERRYWKAMATKDTRTLEELTDFPCLVTCPQGVASIDRQTFTKMVQDPSYSILDSRLSDFQVRPLTDDVAVVAYKVHEQLVVEGKSVTIDAADAST